MLRPLHDQIIRILFYNYQIIREIGWLLAADVQEKTFLHFRLRLEKKRNGKSFIMPCLNKTERNLMRYVIFLIFTDVLALILLSIRDLIHKLWLASHADVHQNLVSENMWQFLTSS